MKTKAIIPLILGLGIGIVAIKLFVDKLQSARASNKVAETVDVVTATTQINSTLGITESMLEVKAWPKHLVPEHTFRSADQVVGRVTNSPIAKGGFISETLLAPPGTPPGMASRLEEGYRAMAIKVDEVASVGGWIQPGSKVDVLCVLRPSTRGAPEQSRLLLQNVEVITVGDKIESNDSGAQVSRSVTLKLTPEQVAKVNLATTKGKLSLAMRNPEDETVGEVAVTDKDLFENDTNDGKGQEAARERIQALFPPIQPKLPDYQADTMAAAPQPKPWTVEVISPNNIYEVEFENNQLNARRTSSDARRSGLQGRGASQIGSADGQRRPNLSENPVPDNASATGAEQDVEPEPVLGGGLSE